MLQESDVHFEVMQEYSASARGERIVLGNVRLNLAEFVDGGEDGEGSVIRRYLMQDSKINSTLKVCEKRHICIIQSSNGLKIGIYMRQTEGDRNFTA